MALRGINLGGWLIAERWMTPSLFEGVIGHGERAIARELPRDVARKRLREHRDTFITEKDFRWIARHGFDFVRLPVGYWLFYDDEGFISGEAYLRQAFAWAEKYGLKVVLDFHGLQGSQNGQDHSGQVGKVKLYRRKHMKRALETVKYLSETYGHKPTLLAFELINEPKVHWFVWRLVRYYVKAYRIAQRHVAPEVKIIVSDAFQPLRLARALSRKRLGEQLVLDVHLYQLFSAEDQALNYEQHLQKVNEEWSVLTRELSNYMPILVGEWSAVLPEPALKMRQRDTAQSEYYKVQLNVFNEHAWAHSYWSYKTPEGGPWSYRHYESTLQK